MKTAMKRLVMWLYCHDVISERTTSRLFEALRLAKD